MPHRILVSDKLALDAVEILQAAPGFEVDVVTGLSPEQLTGLIGSYDGLLVRSSTRVTPALLAAAGRLKVVGRAGIGVDNIDIPGCSAQGVLVMNTPGGNTLTTAEHSIAMLLALARHIPPAHAALKQGQWLKSRYKGVEVTGKTLGILGLGSIGRIVANRARGLHMRVIAHAPLLTASRALDLGIEQVSLDELYAQSDFISVHLPRNPATLGCIGAAELARMRRGVRIINVARGGIIDEAALLLALEDGQVAGAALDVFAQEPPPADDPLVAHPRVIVTPHLGASTVEAQERVAVMIAEQVRDFLTQGTIRNALNGPSLDPDELRALAGPMELATTLGRFLAQWAPDPAARIEIEVSGVAGSRNLPRPTPVIDAALAGYLSVRRGRRTSWLDAPHKADDVGIEVVQTYRHSGGEPRVRVAVVGDQRRRSVTGVVTQERGNRITKLDGAYLDAQPAPHLLVLENTDTPGVVGAVGTLLGREGLNIAQMQMGLRRDGGAISVWTLSSRPSAAQREALEALPAVSYARLVQL